MDLNINRINSIQPKTSYFKDYMNKKKDNNQINYDFSHNICNHDPKSLETTLVMSNKRTMVVPKKINYYCCICGECFIFEDY